MTNRAVYVQFAGEYAQEPGEFCVYCGSPREAYDHVAPVAVAALIDVPQELKRLVPSCTPCNSLAGARYFKTFGAKRDFILQRRVQWLQTENAEGVKKFSPLRETGSVSVQALAAKIFTLMPTALRELRGRKYMMAAFGWQSFQRLSPTKQAELLKSFVQGFLEQNRSVDDLLREDFIEFLQDKLCECFFSAQE